MERSYLSKLFHKEVGQTISDYIMEKKLQTARNMLLYSDFSCTEISSILHLRPTVTLQNASRQNMDRLRIHIAG
ncbi:MAG: hypothetical protein ACLTDF_07185 [Coprococcus sp.]